MWIEKTVTIEKEKIIGFSCNKCGQSYYNDKDFIEMQEFLHWSNTGGFGSVWGDGNNVELHLCQHCAHELLGAYVQNSMLDI